MRNIFQRARRVLIWLGHTDADYAKSSFELATRIFHQDLACISPLSAPVWRGIQALFKQSWFWRLWCLQEVVLASSAECMWGEATIPWHHLGYAAAWIRNTKYELLRYLPLSGVYNATLMYSMSGGLKREPFLHLMMLTRQFETSDSRDRVYGLLGLPTTDADPNNLDLFQEPDYSKDKYTLYEQLAYRFIQSSHDLTFLAAVQHGTNVMEGSKSWIPQWDRHFTGTIMPIGLSVSKFMASTHLEKRPIQLAGSTLVIQGVEFDSIACSSDILPTRENLQGSIWRIFQLWTELVATLRTYPTGHNLASAFCWTLTAGKDWYGELVINDSSQLSDFVAFLHLQTNHELPEIRDPAKNLLNELGAFHHGSVYTTGDSDRFLEALCTACSWRRFFVTKKGYMGIGPACMQKNDLVCVLSGGYVPFILRPNAQSYQLIGETYVHGIMLGEACHQSSGEATKIKPFHLD